MKPRPSLTRVEELCAKHAGTCTQPCESCDLAGEVAALLRLLRIVAESEPALEPDAHATELQRRIDECTPPAAELSYTCSHVRDGLPITLIVTCKSVPPSRADLLERSELCAICAGRVIVTLQHTQAGV